jgi:hypothetical protein
MENKQIAFRRVKGRIIPIKLSPQKVAEIKSGSGLVAGGLGVGVAAGFTYRRVNSYATRKAVKAFRTLEAIERRFGPSSGSLFSYARKVKAEKMAFKEARAAKIIGRFAAPLRLGGRLAASTLIGVGAAKIYEGVSDKKPKAQDVAAIGSAAALGAFLTGSYGRAGLRRATKGLYIKAYPVIRLLKTRLKL